ncbi:WD40-repeat-containing domain protein [Suillus clintonianus]|uniref:WD40-repeat-containing domain protein n=1 Tax=Suillus clintonianus TaxID=1904413 RepID=UPI001B861559|nr:WD40-repeat-containing domain protein [Suillus clintonianus]KAG2145822.1 WD40-repeat-containing domain protein [Suillus clintonianus]
MSSSISETPAITPRWTMRGHTALVTGVVYLPGERRIITCSLDGPLRLWDLESGAQIGEDWRDKNHGGMWSVALSPDAKTVATGSGDGMVRLWDVDTRKDIAKWMGHTNVVYALCWSADGKRVASGSWNGTARVWDVDSGETILTIITGHYEGPYWTKFQSFALSISNLISPLILPNKEGVSLTLTLTSASASIQFPSSLFPTLAHCVAHDDDDTKHTTKHNARLPQGITKFPSRLSSWCKQCLCSSPNSQHMQLVSSVMEQVQAADQADCS